MNFSGKVAINNCEYDCHIKNSEMVVTKSGVDFLREQTNIGWDILLRDWITLLSDDAFDKRHGCRDKLIVRLQYKSADRGVLCFDVTSCMELLERTDSVQGNDIVKLLTIRSDIIDKFYWSDRTCDENIESVASIFCREHKQANKPDEYKLNFEGKEVIISFVVTAGHKWEYGSAMGFPFQIFVALNIECETGLSAQESFVFCHHIKSFLSFISNARDIFLDEILVNTNEYMDTIPTGLENYASGKLYLTQEANKNDKVTKIIPYVLVKNLISSILDKIVNGKIFVLSLFQYENDAINTIDISNVCSAFESQFRIRYPKFNNEEFDKVKSAVKAILKELENCPLLNGEMVSDFVNWNSNYSGTLKMKLDHALNDFIEMFKLNDEYWEHCIDLICGNGYNDMPKRMKNARNALAHGNNLTDFRVLHDTCLLRAVTYAMILTELGLDSATVVKCVKKLFMRY